MKQLKVTRLILFLHVFVCCSFHGIGQEKDAAHIFNSYHTGNNLERVAFSVGGSESAGQGGESSQGRS